MTGVEFHKKIKFRSGVLAVLLLVAIAATFKFQVFGFEILGVLIIGFFGYLWMIYTSLEYMVNSGEEKMVEMYLCRETWDELNKREWASLQAIYSLCAPVSAMMPHEVWEYQLHRAAAIAIECKKQTYSTQANNNITNA